MFSRDEMLTIPNSQHSYPITATHTNYPPLSRHYVGGYVTWQEEKADLEPLRQTSEVLISAEPNDVCVVILMKKVI